MGMNRKTQKAYDHLRGLSGHELEELLQTLPIFPLVSLLTLGMKILHDCMSEANDEIQRLN
jgi:hypothetical protein